MKINKEKFITILGTRRVDTLTSIDGKIYKLAKAFDSIDKGFYLLKTSRKRKDIYVLVNTFRLNDLQYINYSLSHHKK